MAYDEFRIDMVLMGPPRVNNRFAKWDTMLSYEYATAVAKIGDWYSEEIRRRFAASHGQSGETADSIEPHIVEWTRDQFILAVRIGGHVGFVVNPLPTHMETAVNAPALGNFSPTGASVGRVRNFYSEFGAVWNIEWKQGDKESHSPDTEWYEGENSALYAQASRDLHKLATFVQIAWNDATKGEAVYTRASARMQYTYLRNR